MPARTTSYGTRVALLFAGLLIGLLLAEGLLRGAWADRFVYRHPKFIADGENSNSDQQIADDLMAAGVELSDGRWEYRLKPDFNGRLVSSEFDVSFRTNSRGFRGPALRALPPTRLLALGDSFTMGFGVEAEESFPFVLARLWGEQAGEEVEPVNAGVVGYNPYNSYEAYLDHILGGDAIDPDVVVLQLWAGDDLCGPSTPARPAVAGDEGPVVRFKSLIRRSRVAMLVRDTLRRIAPLRRALMDRGIINRTSVHRVLSIDFAERCNAELDLLGDLLVRFDHISQQRGIRFVVALIPLREQVYAEDWEGAIRYDAIQGDARRVDLDAPNRAVAKLAERQGIELFDATSALRDHRAGERLYFASRDPHLTTAGHAVVGQGLLRFVVPGD